MPWSGKSVCPEIDSKQLHPDECEIVMGTGERIAFVHRKPDHVLNVTVRVREAYPPYEWSDSNGGEEEKRMFGNKWIQFTQQMKEEKLSLRERREISILGRDFTPYLLSLSSYFSLTSLRLASHLRQTEKGRAHSSARDQNTSVRYRKWSKVYAHSSGHSHFTISRMV